MANACVDEDKAYKNFDDMNLREELLRGIYSYGFETPSVIQQHAIVPGTLGRDIIMHSLLSSGRTAALVIALLQQIDTSLEDFQAIILVPHHHAAVQLKNLILNLGQYMHIKVYACLNSSTVQIYGGTAKYGCQILIGTPIRIFFTIERKQLHMKHIKILILNKVDTMSEGFLKLTRCIFKRLLFKVQVMLSCTAITADVLKLCHGIMHNPIRILLNKEHVSLEQMKQFCIYVDAKWKMPVLWDVLEIIDSSMTIIFSSNESVVAFLVQEFINQKFSVATLHKEMTQAECAVMLQKFNAGYASVLIITDSIINNVNLPHATLVINFDLPIDPQLYLLRVGRVKCFGRKGLAINLITEEEQPKLKHIENYFQMQIKEMPYNILDLI